MRATRLLTTALLTALGATAVAGCSLHQSPAPTPSTAHAVATTHLPAAQQARLGASLAQWSRTHVLDTSVAGGTAWDPMPTAGARGRDRFFNVSSLDGRIVAFEEAFAPFTTQAVAGRDVQEALPPDARLVWTYYDKTCLVSEYRSPTLATVLPSGLDDPRGLVTVEYTSMTAVGGPSFTSRDVTAAMVSPVPLPEHTDFAGC